MENFEDLIDKLRPIDAHQIDSFYADKFAVSVLRMLLKLGVKENEVYRFDGRKKRLRQLDKDCMGISFCFHDKSENLDRIDAGNKFVEFMRYFADDFNGEYFENCGVAQIFDMDWWGRIYNYLRIEVNSKTGKNRRKQLKENKGL